MSIFKKTMVYLGLVDDEEFDDYDETRPEEEPSAPYKAEPNVRKLHPREARQQNIAPVQQTASSPVRPMGGGGGLKNSMHIIDPKGFGDAELIGEKFRQNTPVLMNLQYVDTDLAKRLIDFASGLTFGLGGHIQRAADKVFLLVPASMDVSAEDKLRMQEQGLFNQF